MSKDRMIWLDSLRLVAGLSMVLLHSTADPYGQAWSDYSIEERAAPLILRAFVYVARTELFLIISAFLLLLALDRRPRSYLETVQEQTRRLLVPFAFWTVFFALYNLIKATAFDYQAAALSRLWSPTEWLGFFLLGDVKYHMHFLPTLFGLILFYPLFRLAFRKPILGLSVFLCLLMRRELDAILYSEFWGDDPLPYLLRGVKILTYVGYGMFAGSMLGIWQRTTGEQRAKAFVYIALLGAILFSFKLTAMREVIELGRWVFDDALGYWADFLMPCVLFAGCLCLGHKSWPNLIARLAPFSFGIYLCHPIFLDLCEIILRDTDLTPIAQVTLKISATLAATSVFVGLISRSKIFAWTIGLGPLPSAILAVRHKRELPQ